MKRIVNGHYAGADTTWSVIEMSPDDFDAIKDSIYHLKGKYGFLIGLSDEAWRKMMIESKGELVQMSLDEFAMSDETMIEGRKVLKRDMDIVSALEARVLLLALSNEMTELIDLSHGEFRVLVDAIRNYCIDLTNVINSSKEEILAQVQKMNQEEKIISEERLADGLDKITAEEHQEKTYEKIKTLYSIIETINQPYEGAEYLDADGNKLDTTNKINESTPSSIN